MLLSALPIFANVATLLRFVPDCGKICRIYSLRLYATVLFAATLEQIVRFTARLSVL